MRRYEMMVILHDALDDEAVQGVLQRIRDLITNPGGTLIDESFWGKREYAYEIDKRMFGTYVVLDFELTSEALNELERQLKLSDNVVRFKTVRPELRVTQGR